MNLKSDEIHLWFAFPDEIQHEDLLSAYENMLTEEELTKQRRFYFDRHRHQYLVSRALVRSTLSSGIMTCLHGACSLETVVGFILFLGISVILAATSLLWVSPSPLSTLSRVANGLSTNGISGRLSTGFSKIPIGFPGKL